VTGEDVERLTKDYRSAFLRYLSQREEAPRARAYEIGRSAVTDGLSLLDLTQVHHQILLEVLRDTRPEDLDRVAVAASEFLLEALATYDMTQRRLLDGA
jgi:hypothetical protein